MRMRAFNAVWMQIENAETMCTYLQTVQTKLPYENCETISHEM